MLIESEVHVVLLQLFILKSREEKGVVTLYIFQELLNGYG